MIKTTISFLTLFGVITVYGGDSYFGNPLFCDTDGTLFYDESIDWVALPLDGTWECGDSILIVTDDYRIVLPVLDSGLFKDNCVIQPDGSCLSILADLPFHTWRHYGISAKATVINLSRLNRLRPDMMVGYLRE